MSERAQGEATADTGGEPAQSRDASSGDYFELPQHDEIPLLDWQPELDSALEAIDSRLPVKRRRATDPPGSQFPRPEVSIPTLTPEVLDLLATRVAQKLYALQAPPKPRAPAEPQLKPGTIVSIRYRRPRFSFRATGRLRRVRA